MPTFRDYKKDGDKWITLVGTDFFPNHLEEAKQVYRPLIEEFGDFLQQSNSSIHLLRLINKETGKRRVQLLRIFKRYVSPDTSVEMLKVKKNEDMIIRRFGNNFRDIDVVKKRFKKRPKPDEALIAVLTEYADRGEKGYDLQTDFFNWFENKFGEEFTIKGPKRSGPDIYLDEVLEDYPTHRPVDFIICDSDNVAQVVGVIRYDSNRGGAQEDDRTSGYRDFIKEITSYSKERDIDLKVLLINDGPGLLLGSMWDDYSSLEEYEENVKVCTLKMLDERINCEWLTKEF